MELVTHISCRILYPIWKITSMQIIRYLQTGYLLHLITITSTILFIIFGNNALFALKNHNQLITILFFGFLATYFFSLLFFSQLDAFSRYQNYKMVKDKIYQYRFDHRILRPFIYSRCQRDAISIAAKELNHSKNWKLLIHKYGFRWYHLLPHLIVKNPLILFTKQFWLKTLFVKSYQSKYFLW